MFYFLIDQFRFLFEVLQTLCLVVELFVIYQLYITEELFIEAFYYFRMGYSLFKVYQIILKGSMIFNGLTFSIWIFYLREIGNQFLFKVNKILFIVTQLGSIMFKGGLNPLYLLCNSLLNNFIENFRFLYIIQWDFERVKSLFIDLFIDLYLYHLHKVSEEILSSSEIFFGVFCERLSRIKIEF